MSRVAAYGIVIAKAIARGELAKQNGDKALESSAMSGSWAAKRPSAVIGRPRLIAGKEMKPQSLSMAWKRAAGEA